MWRVGGDIHGAVREKGVCEPGLWGGEGARVVHEGWREVAGGARDSDFGYCWVQKVIYSIFLKENITCLYKIHHVMTKIQKYFIPL